MKIYRVGGCVRDSLLGSPVSDIDYVVVGATPETLLAQGFKPVGADFPVFLHPQTGAEYALARTERKRGRGYQGFTVDAHPGVTLEADLSRRDLTINAMAQDASGTIIDPYGGQADLQARLLRHVSPAFSEDPLRILRVARFAARYAPLGFQVAPETLELMRDMAASGELADLTPERCWKEIARALMEPAPQAFIETLRACGALSCILPEIDQLFGIPQRLDYHPEGDAGIHILLVLQCCARQDQPLEVRWACLLHDVGKALTPADILPAHSGHESRGLPLIQAVNARYKVPRTCADLAHLVGQYHLLAHRAWELRPGTLLDVLDKTDVWRRPERFAAWLAACEMDARGRQGLENQPYSQRTFWEGAVQTARAVAVQPLLARGLGGKALAEALRAERLQALSRYREGYRPQ